MPDRAAQGQGHAGTHRPLHPNPTRKRDVLAEHCQRCGADVSGVAQAPVQAYDRIEIHEIKPDVTQVTLHGGVCPCCRKRFRAAPPAELEPGSPFGPNLRALPSTCASSRHPLRAAGAADVRPAWARHQRRRSGQYPRRSRTTFARRQA